MNKMIRYNKAIRLPIHHALDRLLSTSRNRNAYPQQNRSDLSLIDRGVAGLSSGGTRLAANFSSHPPSYSIARGAGGSEKVPSVGFAVQLFVLTVAERSRATVEQAQPWHARQISRLHSRRAPRKLSGVENRSWLVGHLWQNGVWPRRDGRDRLARGDEMAARR